MINFQHNSFHPKKAPPGPASVGAVKIHPALGSQARLLNIDASLHLIFIAIKSEESR